MKRALGRVYPAAIKSKVDRLGARIDALLPSSLDLALKTGTDVPRGASALNGRLVNEVVIVAAQVTDAEAQVRIDAIEKDVILLEKKFRDNGVALSPKDSLRLLSKDQATQVVGNWNRGFEVYDDMTKRMGRVKAGVSSSPEYADVAMSLQVLDNDVLWTKDAFEQLQDLADGRDDVEVDGGTFLRMSGWLSEALTADNKLKRLEGSAEGKPARVIPSVSAASPWISIIGVTAGLGGVGMVLWMSIKD